MESMISVKDWQRIYLEPVRRVVENGAQPTVAMTDGFAGFVLDGILAIKDVNGEEATDWECVEMISELISAATQYMETHE